MAPSISKTTSNASSVGEPLGVVPAMGPGAPIEIVFTFDTTGSMRGCLAEVRAKLADIVQRLFADIPNLTVAIFAHGDYDTDYVTKYVDFTNDVNKLCDFVQKVSATGGCNWEECYELVLRQARTLLSWTPGTQRALVMIGDAMPHDPSFRLNYDNIDWKDEAGKLRDGMGVRVYSVQAYKNDTATPFWSDLAKMTFGKHLNLGQFDTIVDMMMAICYREGGAEFLEAYEKEVRAREGACIRNELDCMFNTLRSEDTTAAAPITSNAEVAVVKPLPVSPPLNKGGAKRKMKTAEPQKPKATIHKASQSAVARRILRKAVKTSDSGIRFSLGKQYRETVRETTNDFRSLNWSKWRLALAPAAPTPDNEDWIPRRNGDVGVRNQSLYAGQLDTPAVYEMAVQTNHRHRLYPVYVRGTAGSSHHGRWESYLLKDKRINSLASDVLQKNCKLFIRRAKVNRSVRCNGHIAHSVKELSNLIRDTYDYAWSKTAAQDSCRTVVKGGVVISQ